MASGFFQQVWRLVGQIPKGRVASYGQIAALLGNPRAARTVGWAMHSCPAELDLPWHRVINSKGKISLDADYAGGDLQQQLLEAEGVQIGYNGVIDMQKYGWQPLPDKVVLP
ncbi:MAG TPA: MGMT family protein [bacterium]|nr:MGMT family protein [bacterium]HPN42437.1 MGMT family protein [bacterium]